MNALVLLGSLAAIWVAAQTAVVRRVLRPDAASGSGLARAVLLVIARALVVVVLWSLAAGSFEIAAGPLGLLATTLGVDTAFTVILAWRLSGRPTRSASRRWAVPFAGGLAATFLVFGAGGTCLGTAYIPNSSMSPNIRGYHVVEPLPGGTHLVVAANTPGDWGIPPGEPSGAIVAETYEYREAPRPDRHTAPADRFLWNQTRRPERWDAVVFSYPGRPGDRFVKRLVGLPGERVDIRDGSVWVNGERLTPPARLGPVRYSASPLRLGDAGWTLGADECFLLGDNTDHCSDSRDRGPVPRSHIHGVVEAIYWPRARWRLFP